MRTRIALWCVCVAISVVGVVAFLLGDVFVLRGGGEAITGHEVLSALVAQVVDAAWRAARSIDVSYRVPDPEIWIGVATVVALAVPISLRGRPTTGVRRFMTLVTIAVGFAIAATAWGAARRLRVEPGPAFWIWAASLVLLCLSPWLRRRDLLDVIAHWERRPHPPTGDLPVLSQLPPVFADLVRETRAVRVSFDVLTGLDRDARQLLWEWCRRVEDCAPDDRALLLGLGLAPAPVRAILDGDAAAGPLALHEIDAALARFEHTLLEYRSYAFR